MSKPIVSVGTEKQRSSYYKKMLSGVFRADVMAGYPKDFIEMIFHVGWCAGVQYMVKTRLIEIKKENAKNK